MDWPWYGHYMDNSLEELKKLNAPPMLPNNSKKKRTVPDLEDEIKPAQKSRDQITDVNKGR